MVDEIHSEPPPEAEAIRLKVLAEEKFTAGNIKSGLKYAKRAERLCSSLDGISEMITAFKVLRSSAQPVFSTYSSDNASSNPSPPDYYEILQVERFAHINTIKKQYKKLALILHPDKNTFVASEEAFKHVGEAFRVLSDKIKRKEYDMKVRIAMQDEIAGGLDETEDLETFWTLCSTCSLLHKFDRKYLEHNLMCPSCRKSFKAVEVKEENATEELNQRVEEVQETSEPRVSDRIRSRKNGEASRKGKEPGKSRSKGFTNGGVEVIDRKRAKRAKVGDDEEMITLAEFWKLAKKKGEMKKVNETKKELDIENEKEDELPVDIENGSEDVLLNEIENDKNDEFLAGRDKSETLKEIVYRRASKSKRVSEIGNPKISKQRDFEVPLKPYFYDFDKDRQERSFKKGQIWAVYENNEEGMPRNYALVEEIASIYPFKLNLSLLDYQSNGNDQYLDLEKKRFHIPCGKFKVSDKKASFKSLKTFSHVADSERIARELYMIYPKKGSIWALYNNNTLDYGIVVLLTTYSHKHGMSVAYLVKVDGYRTVFKRREVGLRSPLCLSKDDLSLFSHRIPARKLSSEEVTGFSGDCWELDPSALPSEPQLSIGLEKTIIHTPS